MHFIFNSNCVLFIFYFFCGKCSENRLRLVVLLFFFFTVLTWQNKKLANLDSSKCYFEIFVVYKFQKSEKHPTKQPSAWTEGNPYTLSPAVCLSLCRAHASCFISSLQQLSIPAIRFPFDEYGKWGCWRLRDLPKVTQLGRGSEEAEIWTQAAWN